MTDIDNQKLKEVVGTNELYEIAQFEKIIDRNFKNGKEYLERLARDQSPLVKNYYQSLLELYNLEIELREEAAGKAPVPPQEVGLFQRVRNLAGPLFAPEQKPMSPEEKRAELLSKIAEKAKSIVALLEPDEKESKKQANLKKYLKAKLYARAFFQQHFDNVFRLFPDELFVSHREADAKKMIEEVESQASITTKAKSILNKPKKKKEDEVESPIKGRDTPSVKESLKTKNQKKREKGMKAFRTDSDANKQADETEQVSNLDLKQVNWGLEESVKTQIDILDKYFPEKKSMAVRYALQLAPDLIKDFYEKIAALRESEEGYKRSVESMPGIEANFNDELKDAYKEERAFQEKLKGEVSDLLKIKEDDSRETANIKKYLTAQLFKRAYFTSNDHNLNVDDFSMIESEAYKAHKLDEANKLIDEINNSVGLGEKISAFIANLFSPLLRLLALLFKAKEKPMETASVKKEIEEEKETPAADMVTDEGEKEEKKAKLEVPEVSEGLKHPATSITAVPAETPDADKEMELTSSKKADIEAAKVEDVVVKKEPVDAKVVNLAKNLEKDLGALLKYAKKHHKNIPKAKIENFTALMGDLDKLLKKEPIKFEELKELIEKHLEKDNNIEDKIAKTSVRGALIMCLTELTVAAPAPKAASPKP